MTTHDMSFMNCELPSFHVFEDMISMDCNRSPIPVMPEASSKITPSVELLDDVTNEIPTDNLVYIGISIDDSVIMSEAIDQEVFIEPKFKSKKYFLPEPLWTTHYWNGNTWVKKENYERQSRIRTLRAKLGGERKRILKLDPPIASERSINLPLDLKLCFRTKIKLYHIYCHTQNAIYCFNKIAEYVRYIGNAKSVFEIDAFVGSIKIILGHYQSDILTSKRQNKLLQEMIKLFTIINTYHLHNKSSSLNRYTKRTVAQLYCKFSDIFDMFDLDPELIYTCQLFL